MTRARVVYLTGAPWKEGFDDFQVINQTAGWHNKPLSSPFFYENSYSAFSFDCTHWSGHGPGGYCQYLKRENEQDEAGPTAQAYSIRSSKAAVKLLHLTVIGSPKMTSLWRLVLPSTESSINNFCIENAKCAIFEDLSYKGICNSNNSFLQRMLTKGDPISLAHHNFYENRHSALSESHSTFHDKPLSRAPRSPAHVTWSHGWTAGDRGVKPLLHDKISRYVP